MNRKSGSLSFSLVRSWVTVAEVGWAGMLVAILNVDQVARPCPNRMDMGVCKVAMVWRYL